MDVKQLKDIINKFGCMRQRMIEGEAYYKSENTYIMERRKYFYAINQGRQVEDFTKANYKMPSGFAKLIVDQKINYLINNDAKMNEEALEVLKNKFFTTTTRIAKDSSNKFYGVLQWYIENGELKYKRIKPEQCILIYDEQDEERLNYAIREYTLNGEVIVEVWDDREVKTYTRDNHNELRLQNINSHITKVTKSGDSIVDTEQRSWKRPPFSILWNNDEKTNDINAIKLFIDVYDLVNSDFANNFDDYGEMYWVLKNYQGQDAQEFMQEFKESRILKVGGDGDAKQVVQEVPHMAREIFLKLLKQDIYEFAMAVDPKVIKGDSTNLTIQALFYNLDLKVNDFELQVKDFFEQCLYFVNRFNEINNAAKIEGEISFVRSKFINEKEKVEALLMQRGFRSDKALLAQMPGVKNIEEELELMAEQNKQQINQIETPFEG